MGLSTKQYWFTKEKGLGKDCVMKKKNKPTERTTAGLRALLFDEIDLLRGGKVSPSRVNSIAKSAGSIVSSVKLELDYQRLMSSLGKRNQKTPQSIILVK